MTNDIMNDSLRKFLIRTSEVWFLSALLLASCAPASVPTSQAESTSAPIPVSSVPTTARLNQIRFALVGEESKVNAWSLFDESGASYNGYVTHGNYWPRLFQLGSTSGKLTPQAAKSLPNPIMQDGDYYVGTISLRDDLKWTDGSAFTANDVVFTAQTALAFELTYDWKVYYDPAYLHHAEAVDDHTVRFYFKQKPNVAAWEYGVLLGPILQKAYWEPKIRNALTMLPAEEARTQRSQLNDRITFVQTEMTQLYASLPRYKFNSADYQNVQRNIAIDQRELDSVKNQLALLREDYGAKIKVAQEALFALDDKDEPVSGLWLPDGENSNKANPSFQSSYERTVFQFYSTQQDAITALKNNEADVLLSPNGIDPATASALKSDLSVKVEESESNQVRFLVFNYEHTELTDPTLRRALNCLIDRSIFAKNALPLESFVPDQNKFWHNPDALDECAGKSEKDRRKFALDVLREAGFSWNIEPTLNKDGLGLIMPDGTPFPKMTLLTPSKDADPLRADAADYIVREARSFGIPLEVRSASLQDVVYDVYSSKDYDMAIVGWKVGILPDYLCQWVGAGNPFGYSAPASGSACEAFELAGELNQARDESFKLQSALMMEFPMLPLFLVPRFDLHRSGVPMQVLEPR